MEAIVKGSLYNEMSEDQNSEHEWVTIQYLIWTGDISEEKTDAHHDITMEAIVIV